jgi:hypothetical protein
MGQDVTGGYRKLRTEKLQNLVSSPNIIRAIKSRISRVHNMHEGDEKCIENYFWKRPSGALGVDCRIILKRILNS